MGMKFLVTGATGFVGRHVMRMLATDGHRALGLARRARAVETSGEKVIGCDLEVDSATLEAAVREFQPDAIMHLAATTFEPRSASQPWAVLQNNIRSTFNLLTVCGQSCPQAQMLLVSSGAVYGRGSALEEKINERRPAEPLTNYGVSKLAAEVLALQRHRAHGQRIVIARPFNLTGPGEPACFVTSAFARQIARVEAGKQTPVIRVGQLDTTRDFTDVRDVADALIRLARAGQPGETYNVCSGTGVPISMLIETLLSLTRMKIAITQDPALLRPVEIRSQVGDSTHARIAVNWAPQHSLKCTLRDVLSDWRERIQNEGD